MLISMAEFFKSLKQQEDVYLDINDPISILKIYIL